MNQSSKVNTHANNIFFNVVAIQRARKCALLFSKRVRVGSIKLCFCCMMMDNYFDGSKNAERDDDW